MSVIFHSIRFRSTLPDVDVVESRMFRLAGRDFGKKLPAFAKLEAKEASEELSTLTASITRAVYHRRRFKTIAHEAAERFEAHRDEIAFDQIAKYIAFESAGALGASRSFVDGVFHIGRRRQGIPISLAEGKGVSRAIYDVTAEGHDLPEVEFLRGRHLPWFEALNVYRNVLVHVGGAEAMAYFPVGANRLPRLAAENVMAVPDFDSLRVDVPTKKGKTRWRLARPHEWRFRKGERLETVVTDATDGLLVFARAVGKLWGLTLPKKESGELPTNCVVLKKSAR